MTSAQCKIESAKIFNIYPCCVFLTLDGILSTDVDKNKVLLVTTDAAPYMKSAMEALTVLYPKMVHVTCAAHGLHRVAELVRTKFKAVNTLVSNVKRTFTKVEKSNFRFSHFICSNS